ncbi:aldo/keto reductase [Roseomonas sp. CCTCC AB2023176]|uniref:aldo/keto reductase n=1 Tax=Roseomonas sp. CCTCC AB2023176 TaxID=3342640 RepID=UPI0035DEC720
MLPTVPLGRSGLTVSAIGLGCMGMSEFYGPTDGDANRAAFDRALELGMTFLDTADMYGDGANEELVGRFSRGRRDKVVIATKFGFIRDPNDPMARPLNTTAAHCRAACDASLRRLGVEVIDLYYAHRLDPATPMEETVLAMADLVRAGKVRALGLSEVSAATLRRADAIHPIAAVQSEYSLFSRDQAPVVEACRDVGTTFVAYSPLSRGLLSGAVRSDADLAPDDFRRHLPRFASDSLARNAALAARVAEIARDLGATPAQVALAWLVRQGVVPIPGTRSAARVAENAAAASLTLPEAALARLEAAADPDAVAGTRYPAAVMERLMNR